MKRFIEGEARTQSALLPASLDDYVVEDNPVRVIDVFVDELDLRELGFAGVAPLETGRPAYHPSTLLKLYLYGYLNRVQSSRRLERETQRNLEVMWLTGRLMPDFKTIASFRKDNGKAIRSVCRQFVMLCRELELFSQEVVAIDGSKFKAVNNRDKNFTEHKLHARMKQVEQSIGRYLAELDRADRDAAAVLPGRVEHLKDKVARLRHQMRSFAAIGKRLGVAPDGQLSLTDPDARSMATSGRGTGVVGYNVQTAVDTKHHLIVAHEVTNVGHDRSQLTGMAKSAAKAVGRRDLIVLADRGYYDGDEIYQCERAGIATLVPKPLTSNSRAEGRFDKRDFVYDERRNAYRCPADEWAILRFTCVDRGKTMHAYWPSACPRCPLKPQCTPAAYRRIKRWEHEAVLDDMQARLDAVPEAATLRRQTVEHVFGTLKAWMGASHFLMKRLPNVRTEMSLQVLAYNIKRAVKLLGAPRLIRAMSA